MTAYVMFHATIVELAWTAATFVGVIANSWGLLDAIEDYRWLRRSGLNGRRETVARWHVLLNAALTWVQFAFLFAGLTACFTANTSSGGTRTARMLAQLFFLSAEPVLILLAIEAHRYRAKLLATRSTDGLSETEAIESTT